MEKASLNITLILGEKLEWAVCPHTGTCELGLAQSLQGAIENGAPYGICGQGQ